MHFVLHAILALVAGAFYESCCVMWVRCSTKGRAALSGLFSMLAATTQLIGIGEAIYNVRTAPFFIVGYGLGSYLAVKISKRKNGKAPDAKRTS